MGVCHDHSNSVKSILPLESSDCTLCQGEGLAEPHSSIPYRQKRHIPYTDEKMNADASKHYQDLMEAIYRHGPRRMLRKNTRLSPLAVEGIRDLRRSQAHWLGYMNPFARQSLFKTVWRHSEKILTNAINPEMITIIHEPWHTNDMKFE